MTVRELIKELQKYDSNLIVITKTPDDSYVVYPRLEKHNFRMLYWDESVLKAIPENQEHVVL
jgi:hypothetical protein